MQNQAKASGNTEKLGESKQIMPKQAQSRGTTKIKHVQSSKIKQ
jgi:hypothetical protein